MGWMTVRPFFVSIPQAADRHYQHGSAGPQLFLQESIADSRSVVLIIHCPILYPFAKGSNSELFGKFAPNFSAVLLRTF